MYVCELACICNVYIMNVNVKIWIVGRYHWIQLFSKAKRDNEERERGRESVCMCMKKETNSCGDYIALNKNVTKQKSCNVFATLHSEN